MTFFITLLTILEVIVCLLLSLLVLMQRPRQEGLGAAFGSGVTDQMFGAQTTNVLQKATVYLGAALFGITFLLAILISRQDGSGARKETFVDPTDKVAKQPAPIAPSEPFKLDGNSPLPLPGTGSAPAPAPAPAPATDNKPATDAKPAAPATAPTPANPAPSPSPTPGPAPTTPPPSSTAPPPAPPK